MEVKNLSSSCHDWTLKSRDGKIQIDATVPGQVQLDLWKHGIIPDPYIGYNDTE